MNCPICGAEIPHGADRCPVCGYTFEAQKKRACFPLWIPAVLLAVLLLAVGGFIAYQCFFGSASESAVTFDNVGLEVAFIDVGQADCALLRCNGHAMLIDAGNTIDGPLVCDYLEQSGVTELDAVVATHQDEDHIGGYKYVLQDFEVNTAYCPVGDYDSASFYNFSRYLAEQSREITVPQAGDSFMLGEATVTFIGPVDLYAEKENNLSIVTRVEYGNTVFLFTGDAESEEEQSILDAGFDVRCDVLKVGHHGSNASSSQTFLEACQPKYGVISVGEDNDYGHPSKKTLKRLKKAGIKVYRTDLEGTIICQSDGKSICFKIG